MKNRLAYFPIGLFGLYILINYGLKPSVLITWAMLIWLWPGVRLTDRECPDILKGAFYSWAWPIWVLRYGIFPHSIYTVMLNDIEIGSIGGGELTSKFKQELLRPMNWLDQALQLIMAFVVAVLAAGVLGSAAMLWAAVVVGKQDANLLVEIIKTWLDTDIVPYKHDLLLAGKATVGAFFILFAKNVLNAKVGFSLRTYFNQPSPGYITIKPIL